ncbi:MAG: YbaB/EbfC family nucleoid-associated protein [Chloroflexi bacterium]|nr:YbaB/EbfC family nucleoid-associated protein [Chloroflexota bacterium]
MMNQAELMRQMQARIQKMQQDLAEQTVEGTAGGGVVTVVVSDIGMGPAQAKIQSIKIDREAVDPEDVETLEDLVLAATNEALAKAQALAGSKMSAMTGGMRIPGLF